jgi:DNA-binding winged helix-turn-helix (wHTH) protein
MADPMNQQRFYEFGVFRLDPSRRLLYRNGDLVHLAPKAIEILTALVERPKEVLSKEELIHAVWPDSYVEESNLSHNIALLRKTLEDGGGARSLIETIPKRIGSPVRSNIRSSRSQSKPAGCYARTRARQHRGPCYGVSARRRSNRHFTGWQQRCWRSLLSPQES